MKCALCFTHVRTNHIVSHTAYFLHDDDDVNDAYAELRHIDIKKQKYFILFYRRKKNVIIKEKNV